MRDQVWADRVRLRHKMKKELSLYRDFFDTHGDAFDAWFQNQAQNHPQTLRKLFMMPRSQVSELLVSNYNIPVHSAFGTVVSAVVEQVANFSVTQYPPDARGGPVEVAFEAILAYDRRGGFTIPLVARTKVVKANQADDPPQQHPTQNKSSSYQYQLTPTTCAIWLDMMRSLAGPKLLNRGPKTTNTTSNHTDDGEDADDGGADDEDDVPQNEKTNNGPSFRSDRRIVRLLIARHWADQLIRKFHESHPPPQDKDKDQKVEAIGEETVPAPDDPVSHLAQLKLTE
eukprot:scaffold88092_cov46-Attheya_sp.AAC.1